MTLDRLRRYIFRFLRSLVSFPLEKLASAILAEPLGNMNARGAVAHDLTGGT